MALQIHPGRGAMTNANWFRRRLVLVACVVLAVLAARVCDCVQRPIITWNRFAAALKSGDLALANSLCDQQTMKVQSLDNGSLMLAVKSDTVSWMNWPPGFLVPFDEFAQYHTIQPSGWDERLRSHVRIGKPGSIWYGHLEVHGGRIVFRSDVRGE